MVVENPKNRIDGSAALAPEKKSLPQKKVVDNEKQRAEREALKKARKAKFQQFLKFNGTVVAAGVIGLVVISRYSAIYNNQKTINELQDNIQILEETSEDLNIKLRKFNNIAYVEETAMTKLNMVKPTSSSAVYYDLDAVKYINPETETAASKESLLSKIKNILFN